MPRLSPQALKDDDLRTELYQETDTGRDLN